MHIKITNEDIGSSIHIQRITQALIEHGHTITGYSNSGPNVIDKDVNLWLYGLSATTPNLARREFLLSVPNFILFQADETLETASVNPRIREKAKAFLRNHWPSKPRQTGEGYLSPMLIPLDGHPGRELKERSHGPTFHGYPRKGRTLMQDQLRSWSPYGNSPESSVIITEEGISYSSYCHLMTSTRLSLTPWGIHPITYRLFEGMAFRCCVIAQTIAHIDMLDAGLKAGVHYVEVKVDFSDLRDKVSYYSAHLDEAQAIANAGYAHYVEYFAPTRISVLSPWMFNSMIKTWNTETL